MSAITLTLRSWSIIAWAVLAGSLTGFLATAGWPVLTERSLALYDKAYPVVVIKTAALMWQDRDSALVHMEGRKLRDCRYLGIRAYGRTISGTLVDTVTTWRDDRPEVKDTKPADKINIGIWRVVGLKDSLSVLFVVSHDCAGRLVVTKMAEIALRETQ